MNIEKKFLDLKFLDKESIDKNKNILKNTFNIDHKKLESYSESIKKMIDSNPLEGSFEKYFKMIHSYAIDLMGEYNIDIKKYFSRSSYVSYNFIERYLMQNLKLNIYLYHINSKKEDGHISQIDAVEKYIKTGTDENAIKYYLDEKDKAEKKKKISDFSRIITMNINHLKKIDIRYEKIIDMFVKENLDKTRNKKCYKIVSNVFIEMMHNVFQTGYVNVDSKILNQKKVNYNYDAALERMKKFFDNNVDIEEKYFWERINNTMFIQSLYFNVKSIEKEFREQQDLFNYLIPVVYLPNVFLNEYFLRELICIYKNNQAYYKYKGEFEDNVKKLCLELAFLVIPLYNKIFSVILYEITDELNNEIIEKYIGGREGKYCIKRMKKYFDFQLDKKKVYNDELFDLAEYLLLSSSICRKIDFDIFELNNVIDFIGSFDEQFLKTINCSDYKLILKDFILKVLFRN